MSIVAYVEEALEQREPHLHLACECRICRIGLRDLLVREIEDAARITGATVTGLGRWVANDPALYPDLKHRGRVPRWSTLVRLHDAISDFVANSCAPEGGSAANSNTP